MADLVNATNEPGDSVQAALFLREFVAGVPWVHLDIAGPATAKEARYYQPKGATGWGSGPCWRSWKGRGDRTVVRAGAAGGGPRRRRGRVRPPGRALPGGAARAPTGCWARCRTPRTPSRRRCWGRRGLAGFEGRGSLRAWLYRITTNACLRLLRRRPRRLLSADYGPAFDQVDDLGEPVAEPVWLEPYPTPRAAGSCASVELAFVAALQHLPATQRAVLILREVLGFSAAEVAGILDTSPAAVNSALQRARRAVDERVPHPSQQAELDALGPDGRRELVDAFVAAWERADVAALLELLADDARFMPPLPAWFSGRADIGRFLAGRMFATPGGWCRSRPTASSPSPATRARRRPGRRPVPARRDQRGRPARRAGRGADRVHRPGPAASPPRGAMSSGPAAALNG